MIVGELRQKGQLEYFTKTVRAIQADARAGMVPEAELAKAWCAGRDAAADWVKANWPGSVISQDIRTIQPPGGKPKPTSCECGAHPFGHKWPPGHSVNGCGMLP